MSNYKKGLVAYTDGSSIPHPFQHGAGCGGSGVHGYFFHYPTEKERHSKYGIWIATNKGYQLPETVELSKATPVVIDKYFDAVIPLPGTAVTNNFAELTSAAFILTKINTLELEEIEILADSRLVVDGINDWMKNWASNGWRTKNDESVKNVEVWTEIYRLVNLVREKATLTVSWVRGHNKDLGNEFADYNASIASTQAKLCRGNDIPADYNEEVDLKTYHTPESNVHPFLNLKRLYFNNGRQYRESGVYYQTGWNGPEFILGKRNGETTYSVVHIPEGSQTIDAVIEQCETIGSYNTIMYAKLDRLRESAITRYSTRFGKLAFGEDTRTGNLNFLDKKPVVHAVRPGELPLRALDTLRYLHDLLGMFTRGEMIASDNYCVIDITDRLYDRAIKRHGKTEIEIMVLKKEFGVGFTKFDQEETLFGHRVKLNIQFGDDLPSRNHLKKIEVLNPVISLIAWRETSLFIRYACVISTDSAYGIWSNYFANQIVLKPN